MKRLYKNNRFKISAPSWNEQFQLSDGSYYVLGIQAYYEHIIKNHQKVTDNPPTRIYVNKIENRITFKIKKGYFFELLTPETMKFLGSTESKINKDKNGENVLPSEITEIVLVQCNIVNNDYQQDLRVLCKFVPNISFSQLLDILPEHFMILRTFNSGF